MRPVLFVGPTLYGLMDRVPDSVEHRPPAEAGDIIRAVHQGATRIGLVDGVFGSCRSVWHKEIVYALSRGFPVLGAASMGALRAAECASLGMQPIGGIAQEYLDARRLADADVAILHGPADLSFLPLTVSLVDAEHRIKGWARKGQLTKTEAARLVAATKSQHFTERTWDRVFQAAGLTGPWRKLIAGSDSASYVSRKANDALKLVKALESKALPTATVEAIVTKHMLSLAQDTGIRL